MTNPIYIIRTEAQGYSIFAHYPDGDREFVESFSTKRGATAEVKRLVAQRKVGQVVNTGCKCGGQDTRCCA